MFKTKLLTSHQPIQQLVLLAIQFYHIVSQFANHAYLCVNLYVNPIHKAMLYIKRDKKFKKNRKRKKKRWLKKLYNNQLDSKEGKCS